MIVKMSQRSKQPKYMVCVRCMTFNHVNYIENAMDGFTIQETTFPFVCTIIDDASTDGEQEVIKKYLQAHFDLDDNSTVRNEENDDYVLTFAQHKTNKNCYFAVLCLKYNHYSIQKPRIPYIAEWHDAKYIALCEGDDYWTYPQKLQKQVDYMEEHDDSVMCTHAAYWSVEGEMKKWGCKYPEERDLTTDEVIRNGGLYLATCSLVFRRILNDDKPEWRIRSDVGDYPLQILGSLRGALHFFPEIMSVYRFQVESSWTFHNKKTIDLAHTRTEIEWLELFDKETDFIYTKAVNYHLFPYYASLFRQREVSLKDYMHSAKLSHHLFTTKMFIDILYRYFFPGYWILAFVRKTLTKQ